MKEAQRTLLARAVTELDAIQKSDRPEFGYTEKETWDHAQEGLIRCNPACWVDGWEGNPHERMRFVRQLDRLQAAGLIIRVGYAGGCKTHIRITEAGRAAIATEGATDGQSMD